MGFGLLGMAVALLSKSFEDFGAPANSPSVNSIFAFLGALYHHRVYVLWNTITVPLNFAAGLALVAAGAGLLLLKNWARFTSIGCGVYKIVFVVLNSVVFYLALRDILAKSMQEAGGLVIILLVMAGLAGAILSLAYPVLLLYFMTRPKVVLAFQPEPGSPL